MATHPASRTQFGRALLASLALFGSARGLMAAGTTYYVNDHLATTMGITDAAGEIAALEMDAFGSPLVAGEAPNRYTGKPYDADLGAFVFPFRNYRADEARWMSADPSGFPDGTNNSTYATHPHDEVDPLGLYSFTQSHGSWIFSIWYSIERPADGSAPSLTDYGVSGLTGAAVIIGYNIEITGGYLSDVSQFDSYDPNGNPLRDWSGNFVANVHGSVTIGVGIKDISFTVTAFSLRPVTVSDYFEYQVTME